MGALLSRWKTKQTTVELLESLDKDIKDLEEFRAKNQRLQKLWVGRLLLYSSVLYLLACLWVYCWNLPEQWSSKLLMALPLLTFPILVWFMRKLLLFLFTKRTERNNDKLEDLKVEKRKTLEEVMEKETYKNAKLILERFDPEAKKRAEMESTPVRPQMTPRPGQELRQRGVAMRPPVMGTPMTPLPGLGPGATPAGPPLHAAPGGPPERGLSTTQQDLIRRPPLHMTPGTSIPGMGFHPPGPPLARPVLPQERGTVDRVIEYLVGDGPQNRYALICQQCFSHNGMALKEEFEYLAFRCAYCYTLNPARKTRPQAPRLPEFSFERRLRSDSPSPVPAAGSGANTDDSAPPSGDERECEGPSVEAEPQAEASLLGEEELSQLEEPEQLEPPESEHGATWRQEEELHPPQQDIVEDLS
ncbi:endoplasmic reticulum junction formation protein lunapark-B-like isoform X3 [Hypomesus transpacificus]|uniref:endoplasmic reticulum junction formation protein lunapark-B-like isoform X3 n=1 Tax=Hypomesus transpacificus TaxID=137520 RepID=UPI001F077881|nr:endoplasmic reticulum junction formation protein lunapark-B-like isoform X3 [Hypomesus transpacificus]